MFNIVVLWCRLSQFLKSYDMKFAVDVRMSQKVIFMKNQSGRNEPRGTKFYVGIPLKFITYTQ